MFEFGLNLGVFPTGKGLFSRPKSINFELKLYPVLNVHISGEYRNIHNLLNKCLSCLLLITQLFYNSLFRAVNLLI